VAVHVKYPHFKHAMEQLVEYLNGGRADPGRHSVQFFMGKTTFKGLVKKLGDEEGMQELGGTINLLAATLKKHVKKPERSKQPKILDPAGQLDLSSRRVAKIRLPTEEEQPNGCIMNKAIKDLEAWALLNSYWVDIDNT
jgi:hypothetical protein